MALLNFPSQGQDRTAGDTPVAVSLLDGSHFGARMSNEPVVVKTEYGEQKIPFKELYSIRRVNEKEVAVRTSRVSIQGSLASREIELETRIGRLKVPVSDLKSLDIGGKPSLFVDDKTVGLWTFDDPPGGRCVDAVKERAVTLHDMEFTREDNGITALTRKTENSYAEAAADEELQFPAGDFTIEARFRVGTTTRSYVTIVSKNDRANAQIRNYCLLVQSGGGLYWDSLSNGATYTATTPGSLFILNEWTYVALVVEPHSQTVTFYVNGKQAAQFRQTFTTQANAGPIYFGASPPAQSWSGAPEKIQFVRISKGARTAEEIAEWQKALEGGAGVGWRSLAKGIAFRDGGFLGAEFPNLAGARFRSKFGDLTLREKTTGQLSIYKYREKELSKVQDEVKALIDQLGSEKIEERGEAHDKLFRIGAPAVALLREHKNDADEDLRVQVQEILKKFEDNGVARQPIGDVLRMGQTVIQGWIDLEKIEVATKYGLFEVDIKTVQMLSLGEPRQNPRQVLKLRGGDVVEGDAPKELNLEMETDFGLLKIPFKDIEAFSFDDGRKSWVVKTSRLSAVGKVKNENLTLETPAGPITVPLGQVVEFGLSGKGEKRGPIKKDEPRIDPDDKEKGMKPAFDLWKEIAGDDNQRIWDLAKEPNSWHKMD